MSIEENKALIRHAFELANQKNLDAFFKLFAPEYIAHSPVGDLPLEQAKQFETMFFTAFPDAISTIEDLVAEGDKVVVRVNWKGTHKGEFMGIAPTGNKIDMTNALIFRIAVGKLAENWATLDDLRLMQQLGAIPSQ